MEGGGWREREEGWEELSTIESFICEFWCFQ